MNTVRKHPRTLQEAFPRDAGYASAIERFSAPRPRLLLTRRELISLVLLLLIGLLVKAVV